MLLTSLVRYKSLPNNGDQQKWKKKPKWVSGEVQKAASVDQASCKLWTEIYFLPVGVASIYKCPKKSIHLLSFLK